MYRKDGWLSRMFRKENNYSCWMNSGIINTNSHYHFKRNLIKRIYFSWAAFLYVFVSYGWHCYTSRSVFVCSYRIIVASVLSITTKQNVCLTVCRTIENCFPTGVSFLNFALKWHLPSDFRSWKRNLKISPLNRRGRS